MRFTQHPTEALKAPTSRQRGFVLVTALIFLMVLSLLGVMALRGSLFEERFAANDRDLTVARENAELALRDAERDILGLRFDGPGNFCAALACTNKRPAGTRPVDLASSGNFWVDSTLSDSGSIASADGGKGLAIGLQGVYSSDAALACGMPVWSGADWNDGVGRACVGTINAAVPTIPLGTFTDAPFAQQGVPRPRYLIEIYPAAEMAPMVSSRKIFFRITAVGFGRTTGSNGARTSVTLQSVFSAL